MLNLSLSSYINFQTGFVAYSIPYTLSLFDKFRVPPMDGLRRVFRPIYKFFKEFTQYEDNNRFENHSGFYRPNIDLLNIMQFYLKNKIMQILYQKFLVEQEVFPYKPGKGGHPLTEKSRIRTIR